MWRSSNGEQTNRRRRFGALVVLAVGVALVLATLKPDWPRDQSLVFRLPNTNSTPSRLEASFVPIGAARAIQGFTLALEPGRREVRHQVRLPDGDYLVTIGLTSTHYSGPNAPVKLETSEVRRVTLSGEETSIVLEGEGSE
jgi:hypothetical protein